MNIKQRNLLIGLLCALPVIIGLDMWLFSMATEMISEPADMSVGVGIAMLSGLLLLNAVFIILVARKLESVRTPKAQSLLLFGLMLFATSCTRIDAGYEGVKVKQYGDEKGVQSMALVTGRVWYNPWNYDVIEIPLFVQTLDYDDFAINAKDGSVFHVDPTISLSVVSGHGPAIYVKYRKDIEEIFKTTIYNHVKDAYRIQFNKYTTDEVISKREEFETAIQLHLIKVLESEGFHLEQLTSGLKYPEIITNAINAKNQAVQDAIRIENEVKSTQAEAQKKVAKARGDAEALVIQAKADAEANKLRQQSLNGLLISQQFIEKWDGKLPQYGAVPAIMKTITGN